MTLNISWMDAVTTKIINPEAVEDLVFRKAAFLEYLRKNRFKAYDGGVSMDDAFAYAPMVGGAYSVGDPMSTDVIDPIAGQTFPPRTYYTTVAHYLEHLAINRGPAAVFDALRIKHRLAVNTLNAIWEVALFRHGQATVTGIISGDRSTQTNGLDEALNDGVTQGPFGDYFTSYAGQSRADAAINAIGGYKSVPYFVGDQVTGAGGQVTYHHTLQSYLRYSQGDRMPDIGLTSKFAFGFLLERIQNQQVFQFNAQLGKNAVFGANAIKFMNADIMVSDYCPSTLNGVNDAILGNYLLSTFTSVASNLTNQTQSHLPGDGTTVTAGEALYWLNTQTHKFRLSSHPLFKFGWKGYVPQPNGTKVVGQILSMGTETCNAPWLNGVVFGITS